MPHTGSEQSSPSTQPPTDPAPSPPQWWIFGLFLTLIAIMFFLAYLLFRFAQSS